MTGLDYYILSRHEFLNAGRTGEILTDRFGK